MDWEQAETFIWWFRWLAFAISWFAVSEAAEASWRVVLRLRRWWRLRRRRRQDRGEAVAEPGW